jgi:hypothetical protein
LRDNGRHLGSALKKGAAKGIKVTTVSVSHVPANVFRSKTCRWVRDTPLSPHAHMTHHHHTREYRVI